MDWVARVNPPTVQVRFGVAVDADAVYLRIDDDVGCGKAMMSMESSTAGSWALEIPLLPGAYRYRYYTRVGTTSFYCPANTSEAVKMSGIDGLLSVTDESSSRGPA